MSHPSGALHIIDESLSLISEEVVSSKISFLTIIQWVSKSMIKGGNFKITGGSRGPFSLQNSKQFYWSIVILTEKKKLATQICNLHKNEKFSDIYYSVSIFTEKKIVHSLQKGKKYIIVYIFPNIYNTMGTKIQFTAYSISQMM